MQLIRNKMKKKIKQIGDIGNSLLKLIIDGSYKEMQMLEKNKQLGSFASVFQSIREDERTCIARDIHDEFGQQLTGLKMQLSWIYKKLDKEQKELTGKAKEVLNLIDEMVQSVRKISGGLRPKLLDNSGLLPAIQHQRNEFEKRSSIKCYLHTDLKFLSCSTDISTTIFRFLQEALTNIERHSGASTVVVTIKKEQNILLLEIKDNGKGITKEEINNNKSLGLLGMKERIRFVDGDLSIEGIPQKGTTLRLKISLAA